MRATIKLWDNDKAPIATCEVFEAAARSANCEDFVQHCWETADKMALNLTPSDDWKMEMTVTCDFTKKRGRAK
jgi:hypothetical protein